MHLCRIHKISTVDANALVALQRHREVECVGFQCYVVGQWCAIVKLPENFGNVTKILTLSVCAGLLQAQLMSGTSMLGPYDISHEPTVLKVLEKILKDHDEQWPLDAEEAVRFVYDQQVITDGFWTHDPRRYFGLHQSPEPKRSRYVRPRRYLQSRNVGLEKALFEKNQCVTV